MAVSSANLIMQLFVVKNILQFFSMWVSRRQVFAYQWDLSFLKPFITPRFFQSSHVTFILVKSMLIKFWLWKDTRKCLNMFYIIFECYCWWFMLPLCKINSRLILYLSYCKAIHFYYCTMVQYVLWKKWIIALILWIYAYIILLLSLNCCKVSNLN